MAPKKEKSGWEKQQAREARLRERDDGKWAEEFERAGEPDLDNPETDLAYTRKLQLLVLQQMATTPRPTLNQQDCWRRIREMSATVGMTSSKAMLEATVKKLKKQLAAAQVAPTVIEERGVDVPKSPNARGMRRGPRPLPPEEPKPE